jgi:multiple sugar transport system permease protein
MKRYPREELLPAALLLLPFIAVYGLLFIWPTIQMVQMSFMRAPLIGDGEFIGFKNYERLFGDRLFKTAVWNTLYFVLLSVIPSTILGLLIALGVNRLKGWTQSIILAAFFLPYILPVSVVYRIWNWMFDSQYGIAQYVLNPIFGQNVAIFRDLTLFMPTVAFITIWWTIGFNILLFIAGLRNISSEIYEAAELDGATRWQVFRRITWPLVWPVTVLVATIQLILQLKIFDQIYLFGQGGRTNQTLAMVEMIYQSGFQKNQGGYAASAAVILFILIVVVSVLQFQALRAKGAR